MLCCKIAHMDELFKEHLMSYLSKEEVDKLLTSLSDDSLHCVLLNTRKMSSERFVDLFPHVTPHPIVKNAYIFDKNEYPLGKSIYHELGCFYLQEPSASVPAFLLGAKEDDLVLDMCAAPGGKSVQTSFLMNNKGLIVSNDVSMKRASAIRDNVERFGIGNTSIISRDLAGFYQVFKGKFDKVILDAPCSGSGMFRKNEAVKNDWSINKVLKFQDEQKKLIINAYSYLKEGGILCYSTCSFSKEEDEDVVSYLLNNSDAELIDIQDNPLFYKSKNRIGIHLFPFLFPGEGHYIALIKKPGYKKITTYKDDKDEKWSKLIDASEGYHHHYHYDKALFLATHKMNIKDVSSIRYGVKVGELFGEEISFDHHYSHFVSTFNNVIDLNYDDAKHYINGESLSIKAKKGYVLLTYEGIPLDIAKSDERIIKNRYPKYLRKKLD